MVKQRRHSISSTQPLYTRVIAFTLVVFTLFTIFANEIPSFHTHELLNQNHCESVPCDGSSDLNLEESPELCPFFVWNSNSSDFAVSFNFTEHIQTVYRLYFAVNIERYTCAVSATYSSRAPPIPFC